MTRHQDQQRIGQHLSDDVMRLECDGFLAFMRARCNPNRPLRKLLVAQCAAGRGYGGRHVYIEFDVAHYTDIGGSEFTKPLRIGCGLRRYRDIVQRCFEKRRQASIAGEGTR